MLKNASLRFLRDGCYWLPSQTLLVGYSENVLPLIRKFCSVPIGSITDRKCDGEFRGQEAAMPLDDSDFSSEACHDEGSISAMRKELGKQEPKKLHETKDNVSVPQASQEAHCHRQKLPGKVFHLQLLQVVLDTPTNALKTVLDKWVEDGNRLERKDLQHVYSHLKKSKKHRVHRKALQFVEWIEGGELLNFEERDYASHLRALFRYNGIKAAQKYIERVPKHFRNEVLYETLLASCVHLVDVQKAEEVFQKIMNLSSPLTVSACNQMLLLYKKAARKKVACMKVAHMKADGIFMLMENENVNPSPITYSLLIDLKGLSNDMWGVESVIDMMKANGVEPNFGTQTMVAKLYISRGLTGKAEEAIRAMEVCINDKPSAIRSLLDLYAIIGRPDDVGRIWELCTEPNSLDYLAAIGAWGKLGHIEQVEETFENLLRTSQKLTSKYFNAMLSVYSENKLLSKGKGFIERMCSAGCPSDPITWDAIVSIYVNSGEVKKADSFLLNVTEKNPGRSPLFCSYIKLLKAYAEKWDFHNAEKIFDRLKKVRYLGRSWRPPYGFLLEAYVNAGVPAYGLRERMRADRVYPSKSMMKQLNHLGNLQKPGDPEK